MRGAVSKGWVEARGWDVLTWTGVHSLQADRSYSALNDALSYIFFHTNFVFMLSPVKYLLLFVNAYLKLFLLFQLMSHK